MGQHQTRAREIFSNLEDTVLEDESITATMLKIHELSHAALYSYLQYPSIVLLSPADARNFTIPGCATLYTGHIEEANLNDFEVLNQQSIAWS